MKKITTLSILILVFSFSSDKNYFVGKIHYIYSFTDLNGNDITEKMAPFYGKEAYYYINEKNYKSTDEKNNFEQLYNSKTNLYYHFTVDNTAFKIDAATVTDKKFDVKKLNTKEKIAGYDCSAIEVETTNETTLYYFSEVIKTKAKTFSGHNFGGWNKYLKATKGAITLKYVMTNREAKWIWTAMATEVSPMVLTEKDFEYPVDVKLKN